MKPTARAVRLKAFGLPFSFSLACAAGARDACRCDTQGHLETCVGANVKSAVKEPSLPTAYLLRPGSEYLRFSRLGQRFFQSLLQRSYVAPSRDVENCRRRVRLVTYKCLMWLTSPRCSLWRCGGCWLPQENGIAKAEGQAMFESFGFLHYTRNDYV